MSSSAKKHDVFLSFRGEDTRTNFTSHLYMALSNKSIRTYIDDKIRKGEDVWPELTKAIEESDVAIVVFSENYASSTWCLKELMKILECRKKLGQVVIPVFYKVDPSDVRKQTGSYEKAFTKHERDLGDKNIESNRQKVLRWKHALTEAANISGWHSPKDREESRVIENVVNDVLQKLHQRYPTELKGLVRTEDNCKNVEYLLNRYRVIGIWGMGGIGKSTIAKVLFAKLFPKYDHVYFVANKKEYSHDKLFSAPLKEQVFTSNVVGSTFDMRRLSHKKVFIVLDDVDMDSSELLEYLYREYDGLHGNSRLIVTTREKRLLVGKVDKIYEVQEWKEKESFELFYSEAFKKNRPEEGYEDISKSVVKYAGGVPLVLKILGSYLYLKGIEFWKSAFKKIQRYSNKQIQRILEVSYNGLDYPEQHIFLDIAFFFKDENKDHVIRILDACDFEATSGLEVLADKALIAISKSNTIQMHDLLQQMGLEIVRQECSEDPGTRSRLKDNDAHEVIKENKGTEKIQGIALDLSQIKNLPLHADTFTKMKTLRFLKFYNTLGQSSEDTYLKHTKTLEPFSDKLRYIEWIGYPFESLPSPFCANYIVEIHMPHSKVKQLWQGIQKLDYLEGINLSGCEQFEELPDLSEAPRLKWVNLSCCESLRYLHPSVLSSDTFVNLILDGCTKLERVKGEKHLKSLREISVNGCLSLEEFAVSSDLIENLDLSNTGIQTLGAQIGRMHNLLGLNLEGLRLRHFVKELSWLTSLKELKLSDTWLVIDKEQLHVLFDGLRSLQILHMKDFSNLSELPDNISVLSQLYELRLDGSSVKSLPESIKNLESLRILSLENCKELLCLPTLPSWVKNLGAINCTSLVSVSNMKTLATWMWGMVKFITFKNSLKLDGHSCKLIMESLHLTMMHAVFDNVISRHRDAHGYNYTSVVLCLPGSRVPWQIKSIESFINIKIPKLSNLLGFIYSVVLSPAGGMKKQGTKIKCKCHLPKEGMKEAWLDSDIGGLNSNHVYVWYDPFHCDSILKYNEPKVSFEFCVANDEGEIDDSIRIEECGIRLVTVSDVPGVLEELDWDLKRKRNFVELLEKATDQRITFPSIEQFNEEESNGPRNQIDNQQRDLTEHISSDSIVGTESNTEMVELDSAEEDNVRKNHHSDVEESFKSTNKETETDSATDCRQNTRESKEKSTPKSAMDELESVEDNGRKDNFCDLEESVGCTQKEIKNGARSRESITEYTEDVKNKGNKRMPVETDASLHDLIIESQINTEYYESEDKSRTKVFEKEQNRKSDEEEAAAPNTSRKRKAEIEPKSTVVKKPLKSFQSSSKLKENLDKKEVEGPIEIETSEEIPVQQKIESEKEPTNIEGGSKPTHLEAKSASCSSDQEDQTQNVDIETVSELAEEKQQPPQNQEPTLNQEAEESSSIFSKEEEDNVIPTVENIGKPTKATLGVIYKTPSVDFNPTEKGSSKAQSLCESSSPKDQPAAESNKGTSEYTPMDIDDYLNKLDDNPFGLFDFLSEVSISSKQFETTIQQCGSTETLETVLEEVRSLAFSQSLLININKVEYREQIEANVKKLDRYVRDITEEQNKGIDTFIAFYNKAVKICKEKAAIEEKIKNIEAEEKIALDKLQDSKHKVRQLEENIKKNKPKIETIEKRQKEINEAIKELQEENENLNKEKAKLEALDTESATKKEEILGSAKYVSTSLGANLKQLVELKKEMFSWNAEFEGLKDPYKKMKSSPPF